MRKILLIIAGIVLASGFIIPQFIKPSTVCTKMMCYPRTGEASAQVPCNSCSRSQPIFTIGVFTVAEVCSGKEILYFENSIHVSQNDRVQIDSHSCTYRVGIFGRGIGHIPFGVFP